MKPIISVIMSVYDTQTSYLKEAIQSILIQSFYNFEFIIIDDGSDRLTKRILRQYEDARIRIIENEKNIGLTKSLNLGLRQAKGKYIARMDADDISDRKRLEYQYKYMEKHPKVDVLGCYIKKGEKIEKCCGKVSNEWRKVRLLFDNVGIAHPSAFIRKEFLDRNQLQYDETIVKAQDYELWSRCVHLGNMQVCPHVLLEYRIHEAQISINGFTEQNRYKKEIRKRLMKRVMQKEYNGSCELFIEADEPWKEIAYAKEVFDILIRTNKINKYYNHWILKYEIRRKWMTLLIYGVLGKKNFNKVFSKYTIGILSPVWIGYLLVNWFIREII